MWNLNLIYLEIWIFDGTIPKLVFLDEG